MHSSVKEKGSVNGNGQNTRENSSNYITHLIPSFVYLSPLSCILFDGHGKNYSIERFPHDKQTLFEHIAARNGQWLLLKGKKRRR